MGKQSKCDEEETVDDVRLRITEQNRTEQGCKRLEMAGNGWKWLEITRNYWECLEMSGNCLKLL